MSILWICVLSRVRVFFHTCHAYRRHLPQPFYTTFTDLDLAYGSQGQPEVKLIGFIFSHDFHLIGMKLDMVMKQFKLNILRLLLSKRDLLFCRLC